MSNYLSGKFWRRLFSSVALVGVLSAALPAAAQTRRSAPARTPAKKEESKNCTGWSGIVSYRKTMNESSRQKFDGRTKSEHTVFRNYVYRGTIRVKNWQEIGIVFPLEPINQVNPPATVSFNDEEQRFSRSNRKDSCFYNAGLREQWTNTEETKTTGAFAEGAARNFYLFMNDGFYDLSFALPDADGTQELKRSNASGGYCNDQYNGVKTDARTTRMNIKGQSFSVEKQKIDPKNPDVLAGSVTKDVSVGSTKGAITVAWSLRRCPAPLELEAVEFDDKTAPDAPAWRPIHSVTVDGYLVRIRARVTNYSGETKFPFLTFSEMKTGFVLPGGEINTSIAPGESREIALVWDTRGMSREPNRPIKIEMTEETSPKKEITAELAISPRGGMAPIDLPEDKKP